MQTQTPRATPARPKQHQWVEEVVYSVDSLKRERRRTCGLCGIDPTTHAMNPQPCPGWRSKLRDW